jgi:hypothetical protein
MRSRRTPRLLAAPRTLPGVSTAHTDWQLGNRPIRVRICRSGEKPTLLRRQPRSPAAAHQGRVRRPHLPRPTLSTAARTTTCSRRKERHPLQLPNHGLRGHLGVERGNPFRVQIQITHNIGCPILPRSLRKGGRRECMFILMTIALPQPAQGTRKAPTRHDGFPRAGL